MIVKPVFQLEPTQKALLAFLALGFALRLATLASPSIYFPDEVFQYLEVAHKQVFGYGATTWEQRDQVRSPLLPLLLTLPMRLGDWIAPNSDAYLLLPKAMLAFASLAVIWGAYAIGRTLSPLHGMFAAFVSAIWFEFIYFSTQALTEMVALALFFPAAALFLDRERQTASRLFVAGALIAAAAVMRFQYGPALFLFAALCCGNNLHRWLLASAGSLSILAASALLDLAYGLFPFSWLVANFTHNIIEGRSYALVEGTAFYPLTLMTVLLPFAPVFAIIGWPAIRQFPTLALTALANIVVHSLLAHKEYRYILLSSALLVIFAAIGSFDLLSKREGERPAVKWVVALGLAWLGASLLCATSIFNRSNWSLRQPEIRAFQAVRSDPGACGLGVYRDDWAAQGGYSYLHRPLPLYILPSSTQPADLEAASRAFNMVMTEPGLLSRLPQSFRRVSCSNANPVTGAICLYRRPGGCRPDAAQKYEINRWLKEKDF